MSFKINPRVLENVSYDLPQHSHYDFKLDILENHSVIDPAILLEVVREVQGDSLTLFNKYPQKSASFKELVDRIGRYVGARSDNIIVTNGSDSALNLILDTYCCPDSRILIPVPNYPHMLQMVGVHPHATVKYTSVLDEAGISALVADLEQGYDLCYISNPNLPMGYHLAVDVIADLLTRFPTTLFVVDEAYFEYGPQDTSVRLTATARNLIVTRTFSKAFGLAGLRVGYLVSHEHNVRHLKVIHNSKNVTNVSALVANKALGNLAFYRDQIAEIDRLKAYLESRLRQIVTPDSEIYSYNIRHGNFFLIYCRDSKKVTDIFYQYGVCVRDKHDDVPHSIRICVTTREAVERVLHVCTRVNAVCRGPHLAGHRAILLDLDNTMRDGCQATSPFWEGARGVVDHFATLGKDVYILTNNTSFSLETLHETLAQNGISIPQDRILSPLRPLRKLTAGTGTYVVGNDETRRYLHHDPAGTDCVVIANSFFIDVEEMVRVCDLLSRGAQLYVSETPQRCRVKECSDVVVDPRYDEIQIPDLGSFIKIFEGIAKSMVVAGKPSGYMVEGINTLFTPAEVLVIGDSLETDIRLAKEQGYEAIHIDPRATASLEFDHKKGCYSIPSIDHLSGHLATTTIVGTTTTSTCGRDSSPQGTRAC